MSRQLRDREYLAHICGAIDKINRYLNGKSESDFMGDELTQDGVMRNLEIIGEAVSKLSPELKLMYGNVPWQDISGMRNRLIHAYMDVNLEIVWDTVAKVLPEFLATVQKIRESIK